jgi:transposase-like protein
MGMLERCPRCKLRGRPRRYPVTRRVQMLVCRHCDAFWRYAAS